MDPESTFGEAMRGITARKDYNQWIRNRGFPVVIEAFNHDDVILPFTVTFIGHKFLYGTFTNNGTTWDDHIKFDRIV